MSQEFINLRMVVLAHSFSTTSADIKVHLDGKEYALNAKPESLMDLSVHTVVLYTKQSTTDNPAMSETAAADFIAAAKTLIEGGASKFYTVLHSQWNLPAYTWTLVQNA
jgi:hypothetical protein